MDRFRNFEVLYQFNIGPTAGPVGRLTFGHQRDTRPIMEEERRRARMALAARNQERVQEIFALVEAARIRLQRANEARIQRMGQGT